MAKNNTAAATSNTKPDTSSAKPNVLSNERTSDTGKSVTDNRGNTGTKPNRIFQDNVDLKALYDELKTHSAVIRRLDADGYTRSEISQATGKIYQHVRNVLVQDAQKKASKAQNPNATTKEG